MTESEQTAKHSMRWHVIYTKPRGEEIALNNLERQGYECYLPLRSLERLRRGLRVQTTEPLFNRYLFIRLDESGTGPSWAPIRSTLGVSHLLRFGDQPARVEDGLIQHLRRHEQTVGQQGKSLYQTGDAVLIEDGPYAGLNAVYQLDDGDARACVLIQLLNRPARLTLPLASLRRQMV